MLEHSIPEEATVLYAALVDTRERRSLGPGGGTRRLAARVPNPNRQPLLLLLAHPALNPRDPGGCKFPTTPNAVWIAPH